MTTANDVNKMDAVKVDVPLEKIDGNHYLLGTFDNSDRLTQVQTVIDNRPPMRASDRRYELLDEEPLINLVQKHFEGWKGTAVSFWFNRDTGGIIDCTALETAQSASATA